MKRKLVVSSLAVLLFACALDQVGCSARKIRTNKTFLDELPEDLRLALGERPFKTSKISKHLARNVDGSLPAHLVAAKSIEEATRLLSKLSSRQSVDDESLLHGLEVFVHLPESALKCDYEGYIELATSYLLIGGEPVETEDLFARVVQYYGRQHKDHCLSKYEQSHRDLISDQADQMKLLRSVEDLFNDKLLDSLAKPGQDLLVVSLKRFRVNGDSVLKELLTNLLASTENSTSLVEHSHSWEKLHDAVQRQLVDDNLMKKCSHFTWLLKDIYSPARLDALTFAGSPGDAGTGAEFLKHWRLYRACMAFRMADADELAEKLTDLLWNW